MTLGENIQRLRTERGMSQEALAAALEVSRQSVSKWETGASVPELDKLLKLSGLFGVTLDELVRGEKKAEAPASAPPPEQSPPRPSAGGAVRRTAGWLLVILAAAVWMALTVITQNLLGVLLTLPLLSCGVICLTVGRNAGLWCAWALLGLLGGRLPALFGQTLLCRMAGALLDWAQFALVTALAAAAAQGAVRIPRRKK